MDPTTAPATTVEPSSDYHFHVMTPDQVALFNASNKLAPIELTNSPFLDLLPELQLKVLEELVTFPHAIMARELLPIRRSEKLCSYHLSASGETTMAQPPITKVSRKVRKDALQLYYARNVFMMNGNVTEYSCMVPLSRYPSLESAGSLRYLRKIGCLVKIQDRCPHPGSQRAKRDYWVDCILSTTQQKNDLRIQFVTKDTSSPERKKFVVEAMKRMVGLPEKGMVDGHYLLKAAMHGFDGIVCKDVRPQWRRLDEKKRKKGEQLFGASTTNANGGATNPVTGPTVTGPTATGPTVTGPNMPANVANSLSNYFQALLGPGFNAVPFSAGNAQNGAAGVSLYGPMLFPPGPPPATNNALATTQPAANPASATTGPSTTGAPTTGPTTTVPLQAVTTSPTLASSSTMITSAAAFGAMLGSLGYDAGFYDDEGEDWYEDEENDMD